MVEAVLLVASQPRECEEPGGLIAEFWNYAAHTRRRNHAAENFQ